MPAPRAPKTLLKRTKLPVPFSDMPLRTWYPAACCRLPGQARSHGATVTSGVTTTLSLSTVFERGRESGQPIPVLCTFRRHPAGGSRIRTAGPFVKRDDALRDFETCSVRPICRERDPLQGGVTITPKMIPSTRACRSRLRTRRDDPAYTYQHRPEGVTRDRKFADSPLEESGFELLVPLRC
jgi:hypothetical protein